MAAEEPTEKPGPARTAPARSTPRPLRSSAARGGPLVLYAAAFIALLAGLATLFYNHLYAQSPWRSSFGDMFGPVLGVFTGLALAVALTAGVVRVVASILLESQYRLSELLAATFAVGIATSLALSACPMREYGHTQRILAVVLLLCLITLLVATGAAWGWSAAKRRGEERAAHRLLLLLWGWLVALGVPALTVWLA
jgi:hypothetical protein